MNALTLSISLDEILAQRHSTTSPSNFFLSYKIDVTSILTLYIIFFQLDEHVLREQGRILQRNIMKHLQSLKLALRGKNQITSDLIQQIKNQFITLIFQERELVTLYVLLDIKCIVYIQIMQRHVYIKLQNGQTDFMDIGDFWNEDCQIYNNLNTFDDHSESLLCN